MGPDTTCPTLAHDISRDRSLGRRNMGHAGDMSQYLPWTPDQCNVTVSIPVSHLMNSMQLVPSGRDMLLLTCL